MKESFRRWAGRHPRLRPTLAALYGWLNGYRRVVRGRSHVTRAGAFLERVRIRVEGDGNEVRIHPNAWISNVTVSIKGDGNRLEIGEDCVIKAGSLCMEDSGGVLLVGRDTTIEQASIAVTEPGRAIRIGNDCMLAFGIDIRCGDSHAIYDQAGGQRLNPAADIEIRDHVWIGAHATLLKGVRIGSGTVVGTRSLVLANEYAPNSLIAGVPARPLKTGIRWTRQR